MMDTYRQGGRARVYWLTVPTPRDSVRQPIERAVNAGDRRSPRSRTRPGRAIIDTVPIFTPGDRYRDSMTVDGEPTIVRESDGIHLNEAGSSIAADAVLEALGRDYTW